MKKRILALALAATTAFSMLGSSLSVSAIDAWTDKVADLTAYQKPKELKFTYKAEGSEAASCVITYGGEEIDITDIVFATNLDDAMEYEVSNDVPYIYDYVNDNKTTWAEVEEAYNNGDAIALGKLLKGSDLTDTTSSGSGDVIDTVKTDNGVNTIRHAVESAFATFKKGMVKASDITGDDELNVKVLINNINAINPISGLATSQIIAFMQAYNTYIEYAELPDLSEQIEAAQAKLDSLSMRTESDFQSATYYKYFVADLEALQEKLDAADTYAKVAEVETGITTLSTKYKSAGANKTELKDLLVSLFDGKTITTIRTYATYPLKGANGAIINSSDYDTNSDSWKAFAAAYENAVKMYKEVNSNSYQTDVDNMVAELTAAVDGLSSNSTVPNWLLVKVEELLAKAYTYEETDYTKASWKVLESAITKAEAVLDAAKPGLTTATKAADDLQDAIDDLKIQAVTTSEKSALKKTIEAAEKTLKGLDKEANGAQYYALTVAINDAKALYVDNTVSKGLKADTPKSKVAAAIDALNAAIDFSEVVIGWNQLANGTWMYGTEDGYVTSAWKWIGSAWYYFDANGIMATGWLQLDGAWYYMYSWGGMAKGWAQVNGTWYYLNPNGGKMLANGWNWIDGKCYYFYSWGGMAANTTIDGYKVDASGAWVK